MGLILIPHEEVKTKSKKLKNTKLAKAKDLAKSKSPSKSNQSLVEKIRKKLRLKEISRDEKIIGKTCIELIRYAENSDKLSTAELNKLTNNLHRTTLAVQKKKKGKMDKKKKKR